MTTQEKQGKGIPAFLVAWRRPIGVSVTSGVAWVLDVFTVHSLLVSLGLESGDDLVAPWATRLVWWVLFYALTCGWVSRLMWREAVLSFTGPVHLWAAAHVDLVKRVARRVRWWSAGVRVVIEQRNRHRQAATVPAVVRDGSRTVPAERAASTAAAA